MVISWEIPQPPFTKVKLKITYLKSSWNLPGANELMSHERWCILFSDVCYSNAMELNLDKKKNSLSPNMQK